MLCIIVCFLTACENKVKDDTTIINAEKGDHTAKEFVISYDTKDETPNILVNQFGYSAENEKLVYFLGENLSDRFRVFEYGTEVLVYEGIIDQTIKDGYYMGEFTELKKQGTYYIQTEKIGQSYPFTIREKPEFDELHRQLLINISNEDPKKYKEIEMVEELLPVLIAFEMYPTAFFDGDIYLEPNKIPDILDYLEFVATAILEVDEPIKNAQNGFLEAAFLTKLAYNLEAFSQTKANEYQVIAEKRYQEAATLLRIEDLPGYENLAYLASAELYRKTGKYAYRSASEKYGSNISYLQKKNEFTFYADMTHMSTRRVVGVDFCNKRMEEERKQVIDWIKKNGKDSFFYDFENENMLLLYAMKILWVHEVNYSEEYENLEQEICAYFTGLNKEGVSYISEIGYTISKDVFEERLDLNNKFLVLISRYMQQEETE